MLNRWFLQNKVKIQHFSVYNFLHFLQDINKISIQAKDYEELKAKLQGYSIDERTKKDNIFITVGGQLAKEGEHEKVKWMIDLGANINEIAKGYALAGNHEKVEEYKKQGASLQTIAVAYASVGNHEKVEEYCIKPDVNANAIAQAYAFVGNHEKVEEYRIKPDVNVNTIAFTYASIENHEKVEEYRTKHYANVSSIAQGYTQARNHEKVEEYRTKHNASFITIAKGYAYAGNHEKQIKGYINCLLDGYLKERTQVKDLSGQTKEYFYGSFFSLFQKSFKQKAEAVNALKSALNGDPVDLSEHLSTLRNGKLGQELRAFIKSGMGNTLIGEGKKVNTVRDL